MPYRESDAIVVLGAGLDQAGVLIPQNHDRLDIGMNLFEDGLAPNLIMSGGWSSYTSEPPARTEAEQLHELAVQRGVPGDSVFTEKTSRNTLGNAVYTKQQLLVPNEWDRVTLVTSESHIDRAVRVFDFVLGDTFVVEGVPAPDKSGPKRKIFEAMSSIIFDHVTEGVERGDDAAVEQRLIERVPGYGPSTQRELLANSLRSFARRQTTGNTPLSAFVSRI